RFFDRHIAIEPRRPVDIDVARPQASQRMRQEVLYRPRPGVESQPVAIRSAQRAEFYREQNALAPALQRPPDEHLVVAHAIEIAGIDQVDAAIDGRVNGGDALALVGRPVHARHPHASQSERKYRGPVPAERAHRDHWVTTRYMHAGYNW